MAQLVAVGSLLVAAGCLLWAFRRRLFLDALRVDIRLDRSAGAHLIWHLVNEGTKPITITKLFLRAHNGEALTVSLERPKLIQPRDHVIFPTDVDWTRLAARTIAAVDDRGRKHAPPPKQLGAIKEELRGLIDRRVYASSAGKFLGDRHRLGLPRRREDTKKNRFSLMHR